MHTTTPTLATNPATNPAVTETSRATPAVTVHNRCVTYYLRPGDKTPVQLKAPNSRQAQAAAGAIRTARATRAIDADTPLYAALALWAWEGTSDLEDSSWASYRPAVIRASQESGSTRLGRMDKAWYKRWHEHLDTQASLISHVQMSETALGSFATWCTESSTYTGPRPTGSGHRHLHRKYRARARRRSEQHNKKVKLGECPTLDEAIRFGEILGECAVQRWGPEYGCWRHAPVIHFLTGARLGELPTLTSDNFDLDDPHDSRVWIFAQYRDGATTPGNPHTAPTKDGRIRSARIHYKPAQRIQLIVDEARHNPGGVLLPIPHGLKTGKRQLHSLYAKAHEVYEKRYGKPAHRSHWYRRAYVSWHRAPVDRGGYGATDREVADWIGHVNTDLIQSRYDRIVPDDRRLTHDPGEIPTAHEGAGAERTVRVP